MKISESIRKNTFWAIDKLKGSPLSKHYKEIKLINENYNSALANSFRENYLNNLLDHSIKTVPFYKSINSVSLEDFPVIDKNLIRINFNDFVAARYNIRGLHKVTTSGSTGTPFTILQDKNKRLRHSADNIYFNGLADLNIGNRLYYFRIWNDKIRRSKFKNFVQNIITQEASLLDIKAFNDFLERIKNDTSAKNILAYASTLEALSNYLKEIKKEKFTSEVKSIISMSETLPEGTRQILEDFFSCPVISRYSNMENGFIAQQCIENKFEYHINYASYYVEILHVENNKPVSEGEFGRIVVTDLFNYGMPLIRYDTGDIGIWSSTSKCKIKAPVFTSIEGRKVDFIYNTSGSLLSPHVITNTLWKYSEIKQFQFIQLTERSYVMKLNYKNSPYEKEYKLRNELLNYLGSDAQLSFEYVNEIPLLASGKRKKIVNNYRKF